MPKRSADESSGATPVKKKSKRSSSEGGEDKPAATVRPEVPLLSPIASPLANAKLAKRCFKLVKKAAKGKSLSRGVKECCKALKKGKKGLCFIAGDISPIDVITHLPILCEEASMLYCYVPSKIELGAAGGTKRPTSCVIVSMDVAKEEKELWGKVETELKAMGPTVTTTS